ncbi:MAG: ribosomal protein, partial [Clostridiaceae bacterium]|nr:ribosomal protein [Clostridiaceae bacterium]
DSYADFPQNCRDPIKIQGGERMANIKSAKKRIKVIEKKTLENRMVKSALKTTIKKFEAALVSGNADEAKAEYVKTAKALDMAAAKSVIHKNKAARTKSRLVAKLNKTLA